MRWLDPHAYGLAASEGQFRMTVKLYTGLSLTGTVQPRKRLVALHRQRAAVERPKSLRRLIRARENSSRPLGDVIQPHSAYLIRGVLHQEGDGLAMRAR